MIKPEQLVFVAIFDEEAPNKMDGNKLHHISLTSIVIADILQYLKDNTGRVPCASPEFIQALATMLDDDPTLTLDKLFIQGLNGAHRVTEATYMGISADSMQSAELWALRAYTRLA